MPPESTFWWRYEHLHEAWKCCPTCVLGKDSSTRWLLKKRALLFYFRARLEIYLSHHGVQRPRIVFLLLSDGAVTTVPFDNQSPCANLAWSTTVFFRVVLLFGTITVWDAPIKVSGIGTNTFIPYQYCCRVSVPVPLLSIGTDIGYQYQYCYLYQHHYWYQYCYQCQYRYRYQYRYQCQYRYPYRYIKIHKIHANTLTPIPFVCVYIWQFC